MKTLITGSHGFVGRHLIRKCLDLGCDVTGVDDLSTGLPQYKWPISCRITKDDNGRWHPIVKDVREFFKEPFFQDFDLIFHCAAIVGGRLNIENNPLQVATDLAIDSAFFKWCVSLQHRPKRVVYFSSSAAYSVAHQTRDEQIKLAEHFIRFADTPCIGRPDETYGWSKLTGEYLAKMAAEKHGLPVVIYRPFGGYGEDQDLTYPFPAIIQRVLRKEDPITVWGSGDQQRDFIHIDDCVEAVFATMDILAPGEALNLGTGIGTSFKELAFLIAVAAHNDNGATISNDPSKPEGVFYRVADVTKLSRYYQPKISLVEGIDRALTYHRELV